MADHHHDESLVDKAKDTLGMGDEHGRSGDTLGTSDDHTGSDRPDGWAGVTDALDEPVNRPMGPDYAAERTAGDDSPREPA